jgi:AcrR family transcriptional regulator
MRRKLTDEQIASFRERFVAAAEELFEKQGVAGVTMRQIAQAVGYSQTAAYSYFKNKDEILAAVRAAALGRFSDRLDAAYAKRRSARSNARSVGQAYMQFAIDEPAAYRLIFNTDQAEAMRYPALVAALQRARECMTRYVHALSDEGLLKGDADEVAQIFWAGAHGVVMLHLSGMISGVAARDRLHRNMMRLLARGAGMQADTLHEPSSRLLVASK